MNPEGRNDASEQERIQVLIPDGELVVRVPVEPGDVVLLPFKDDGSIMMAEGNGNLGIKSHDTTVVLVGFADAVNDPHNPVIVESAEGVPLDVAVVLAMTDPNLDVHGCGGGPEEPGFGFDNTGGIFQFFEGGVELREIEAIGPIGAEELVLSQSSVFA